MKLWNYIVILTTMVMFLEFLGIPTGLSSILNALGIHINTATATLIDADIGNSSLYLEIFSVLTAISVGGAVIIGLFAKSYDTSLVILPVIIFIGGIYISTFWTLILYVQSLNQSWMTALISIILVPLGIGFVMSLIDYFGGRD